MMKNYVDKICTQLATYQQQLFGVQPLSESSDDIQHWFSTGLGQRILAKQQQCLERVLPELFGYHLMQLSVLEQLCLFDKSATSHQFSVSPLANRVGDDKPSRIVAAEFEHLPIESDSIDVALLHHSLDFSTNPHQVLRETARAMIPNGYIIVIGFNPFSFLGLKSRVAATVSPSYCYRHHYLRVSRLKDWFKVLELELLSCQKQDYSLPFNKDFPKQVESLLGTVAPFSGSFYVLLARKNVTPMTMIKTRWRKNALLPKWQKPVVVPSVSSPKS